jgi:hypothetical protein
VESKSNRRKAKATARDAETAAEKKIRIYYVFPHPASAPSASSAVAFLRSIANIVVLLVFGLFAFFCRTTNSLSSPVHIPHFVENPLKTIL